MKRGLVEREEYAYERHGTLTFIANFEVATGQVIARPWVRPARRKTLLVIWPRPSTRPPRGPCIFVVDQLNMHKSESVVRLIAERWEIEVELGVQGQRGIVQSMASCTACPQKANHPPDSVCVHAQAHLVAQSSGNVVEHLGAPVIKTREFYVG
jgi:putative transposase